MTPEKIDFPPLLPAGLHSHSLESFWALAVEPFPNSARRSMLYTNLQVYLSKLADTGIKARVWLDGSYLTQKPEPDDIDLVVVFDGDSANALTPEAQRLLLVLLDMNIMDSRFKLHVFAVQSTNETGQDYWLHLFGTLRDEVTPKGIAELRVNL